MKAYFGVQRDAVLAEVDAHYAKSLVDIRTKDESGETPEELAAREEAEKRVASMQSVIDLSVWDDTLAKIAGPILLKEARESAKETVADLHETVGPQTALQHPKILPDLFNVVDRNLPRAVEKQTFKFAQSTNETTTKEIGEALTELRGQILEGITTGDTRTEIRKRVQTVFENADNTRATMIAHNESSRARHDAQLQTVKESRVCKSKTWLCSADACRYCQSYAAMGEIPLDAYFAVTSYGPVKAPPGHILCACSMIWNIHDSIDASLLPDEKGLKDTAHAPAGSPIGGQFVAGSGAGGVAEAEKRKPAKRSTEKTQNPATKAEIAKQSATYVGKDIQRYAEEANEPQFAKAVGGLSYADNEPVDVVSGKNGVVENGIELKTMVSNKASKLTMDRYAQVRKVVWEQEKKATFHTCCIDDREVYNAKGEGKHDESKRTYYYRRGIAGSARIESMHKCKSMAEVKKLMAAPESELPAGAQRTDGKIREGKWKAFVDKDGKGFKNSKSGEIVRPKK